MLRVLLLAVLSCSSALQLFAPAGRAAVAARSSPICMGRKFENKCVGATYNIYMIHHPSLTIVSHSLNITAS